MKHKLIPMIFIGTIFSLACTNRGKPPELEVKNTDPLLEKTAAGWIYKKQPFSGNRIEVELNGRVVYKLPIVEGLEDGVAIGYYNSGEKLMERNYSHGARQGIFKQWWPNGNLRYLFNYEDDRYDGKQLVFFSFGKVQEEKNYLNGVEEGVQRIWDSSGKLISNYTVKNKKIYGSLSAKDCMPAYR